MKIDLERRQLLRAAAGLSLGSAAGAASMLASFGTLAATTSGYRALVCVFLHGGMDNHDTVLPYDQPSYDRYAAIRGSLLAAHGAARSRANLLPLAPANAARFGSRQFALPPELAPLHALFGSGAAAIVGNVGPLNEPITRAQFEASQGDLPARLFSHNDQQSTWMSLGPEGSRFGWGGRLADAQIAANANDNPVFSAISLAGNSVFLSGNQARSYQIGPNGVPTIDVIAASHLGVRNRLSPAARSLLDEHFASQGAAASNLFERDLAAQHRRSFEANALFNASAANAPALATAFPNTRLGRQLRAVARTIALRGELGVRRQVFFVGMGGFDTHSAQAGDLPGLLGQLAQAIAAFHAATQELGVAQEATLFTASEFGRTLAVNGDGTDHGWGGHHFVVGGAVQGGSIYGELPPSEFDHDFDAGGGRLIPAVALQQYAATLGRWFGLTSGELSAALPGLGNFSQSGLAFV